MTDLNKLQGAGSAPQISRIQKTSGGDASDYRQEFAEGGNHLPGLQQMAGYADARKQELDNAIRHVSGYVQNITRELNFSIDEELGRTIVTVIDEHTGDVIRQIPSEDMLSLARNLEEIKERTVKGLLFRGDA